MILLGTELLSLSSPMVIPFTQKREYYHAWPYRHLNAVHPPRGNENQRSNQLNAHGPERPKERLIFEGRLYARDVGD